VRVTGSGEFGPSAVGSSLLPKATKPRSFPLYTTVIGSMSDPTCEQCGSSGSLVRLTKIVNDKVSKHVLCEGCAARRGVDAPPKIADLSLPTILERLVESESARARAQKECTFCGLAFNDLREGGLLGCPECYVTFMDGLLKLFQRVHRSDRHVGKVYLPPDPTEADRERLMNGLRTRLKQAVAREDFERAAELRDRLRELEPV